ncbi:MAG: flagellar filament capping protein FliD [Clostridiaceae bacterium]|jgi:flagellar hook-associated protein 2|nr:flagellar filament capping protein FliD [Clostridiaceae bacterium]
MSMIRITGTYSGFDTDKIISDLMKVERLKVDKVFKQKELLTWKKDSYRDISSSLMSFSNDFFDILKPATNFRSSSSFAKFNIQSSNSSAVTATAGASAVSKTHTITVNTLASAAKITGEAKITASVKGSGVVSDFSLSGQSISVTLDGITKKIELEDYANIDSLEAGLEQKLTEAFGAGKFDVVTTDGKIEVLSQLNGSVFSLSGTGLESLGFATGDNTTNGLSLTASLDSIKNNFKNPLAISDPNENVTFTINGKTIDLGKTYAQASLEDVMAAINASDAGAKMTYDSLNNQFILQSKTEGAASKLTIDSSNELFQSLGIVSGTYIQGTDAEFTLDGVTGMKRSSNNFTIDGVSYSLKETSATPVSISVESNIEDVVKNITNFVERYNSLLDQINGKLNEKYDREYLPLTDDEREAMSDKEVEKWEAKAKTGILANDSILSKIVTSMRTALYEKVEGVSISLYDIGIASSSYTDRGKLKIDEAKLRNALTNNFDQVVKLFTNDAEHSYMESLDDSTKRTERYKQSGVAQRLYDIIQDNVRTTRNADGKKGVLLEKAGYANDSTDYKNLMLDQIKSKETLIDALEQKMLAKETALYLKFSTMEKLLGEMQSQMGSMSSMLGYN